MVINEQRMKTEHKLREFPSLDGIAPKWKCWLVEFCHKCFAFIGQVTAQELWRHLGSENTELHHRAAELFYTLHQVTPRAWICEDAIGTDLISDDEVSEHEMR